MDSDSWPSICKRHRNDYSSALAKEFVYESCMACELEKARGAYRHLLSGERITEAYAALDAIEAICEKAYPSKSGWAESILKIIESMTRR